jgi:hypothetical protein
VEGKKGRRVENKYYSALTCCAAVINLLNYFFNFIYECIWSKNRCIWNKTRRICFLLTHPVPSLTSHGGATPLKRGISGLITQYPVSGTHYSALFVIPLSRGGPPPRAFQGLEEAGCVKMRVAAPFLEHPSGVAK